MGTVYIMNNTLIALGFKPSLWNKLRLFSNEDFPHHIKPITKSTQSNLINPNQRLTPVKIQVNSPRLINF